MRERRFEELGISWLWLPVFINPGRHREASGKALPAPRRVSLIFPATPARLRSGTFLYAELQFSLQPRPDYAHYIANWLKALKSDKRAVFTAAARAAEAATFLQAKPSS